jgi:hypothetical protein
MPSPSRILKIKFLDLPSRMVFFDGHKHKQISDPPYTPAFVAVKFLDIGLTTTYFFVAGLLAARAYDSIYALFQSKTPTKWEEYPIGLFTLDILANFFFIAIVAYVLRNLVSAIPYPLDGVAGFQHRRLKELGGGAVLLFIIFIFQTDLTEKVRIYADRVLGITNTAKEAEVDIELTETAD